jgi:hypothetical protein
VIAVERRVQAFHQLARAQAGIVLVMAEHDAIGAHEVVDRRAFFQELRIRDDRETMRFARGKPALREFLFDDRTHTLRGADRNRGLVDDDLEAVHRAADVAGRFENVLEVCRAVFIGRRADGNELHFAVRYAGLDVGRKRDAPRRPGARDDFLQTRLVNRHTAIVEDLDLARIDIQTENVVADFGKTRASDKANVARADDGDFHTRSAYGFR